MTLPASGQISFDELNAELGRPFGSQLDLASAANTLGISYNTSGTNDLQMDEFHGISISGSFTYTTAGVSGFAVSQTGVVTPPTAAKGTIASLTYSTGYSAGSYPAVSSNITRSVTVVVNIPTGYSNSGTVSGTETYVQIATPTFQFSDWNGSVSVSQYGAVSYTTGNATAVSVSPTSFGYVNTSTSRTINVTVTVPAGYYNSGGTVTGTKTATQSALPTFTFADAGVYGFGVAQDGTITAPSVSAGTIDWYGPHSGVVYIDSNGNTSYSVVSTNTTRTATVYVIVPYGYYNEGAIVYGNTTTTQISIPTFTFSDAGASGFVVAQNGTTTAPTVSAGSISSLTYGGIYDTGPHGEITYPIVNTLTERSVDVYVTVPVGYYNSGEQVSGTLYANQSATPTFGFSDWTGEVSINTSGVVSYSLGNASAVSVSPTSYSAVYTPTDRTVNVTVTVRSGYYNSGGTVTGTRTITQPAATLPLNLTLTPGCYNNGFTTQTWVTLNVDDSVASFYYYWSNDGSTWYGINASPVVGSYGQYNKSPGSYYFKVVDAANSSRYASGYATISSC